MAFGIVLFLIPRRHWQHLALPYVIANNGGAPALFTYLVCAVLVAVPLFLYELIIGQNVRLSTIRCYETIRPRWKSLGYASGTMLFMVLVRT